MKKTAFIEGTKKVLTFVVIALKYATVLTIVLRTLAFFKDEMEKEFPDVKVDPRDL